MFEPFIGELGNVSDILLSEGPCFGPVGVDSPGLGPLVGLDELHSGDGTGGVPGWSRPWISILAKDEVVLGDLLVLFARTDSEDLPRSRSALGEMKFTPSLDHAESRKSTSKKKYPLWCPFLKLGFGHRKMDSESG